MKNNHYKLGQNNSKKNHKRTLAFIILVLVLLFCIGLFFFNQSKNNTQDKNADDPTIETAKSTAPEKNSNTPGTTPNNITSEQVPTNIQTTIDINSLEQESGFVTSQATVSGAAGSGNCVFSFTATDAKPVVKQVNSIATGSNQTCSVKISEVEFDKIGTWDLGVVFYKDNTKASSNKSITIT